MGSRDVQGEGHVTGGKEVTSYQVEECVLISRISPIVQVISSSADVETLQVNWGNI